MNGKCDREVGSTKRGWHACNRKAVVKSERVIEGTYPIDLEFCANHTHYAFVSDSRLIEIKRIRFCLQQEDQQ